jgi:hypothetical protein
LIKKYNTSCDDNEVTELNLSKQHHIYKHTFLLRSFVQLSSSIS